MKRPFPNMTRPMATIITDAAYRQGCKRGSWAGRIIYDHRRMQCSGFIKVELGSSNDAEMAAICNAVHRAWQGLVPPGAGILVQTDNQHAISAFARNIPGTSAETLTNAKANPFQQQVIGYMRGMIEQNQPEFFRFRHVKAHIKEHERGKRHHVQEAMDRLCAQEMKAGLAELVGERWMEVSCPTCKVKPDHLCRGKIRKASFYEPGEYQDPPPVGVPHHARVDAAITMIAKEMQA